MSEMAKGGNDVLIAGTTATLSGSVVKFMIGDAEFMSGHARGGADTFVFHDHDSMIVGTDNFIIDFSQSQHDKIQFIGVAGVTTFADLTIQIITDPNSPLAGSTMIHAGNDDAVVLVDFAGTLTEHDFLFG
jgi:hypothetical protein